MNAQTFGAKGGFTFSKWDASDPHGAPYSYARSVGGGGFVRFPIAKRIAVEPELMIVYKGSRTRALFDVDTLQATARAKYIEVPLLLRYPFGGGPAAAPYILAGPAVSYELTCRLYNYDTHPFGAVFQRNCKGKVEQLERRRVDVGGVVAIGMEHMLSAGLFILEARYTHGFVNLSTDDNETLYNRSIALMAGFGYIPGKWPF